MSEKKKEGLDASTSKECKWNHPRKRKPTSVNLDTFEKFLRVRAPNAAWLQSREVTPTNIPCASLPALHKIELNFSDFCDIQSEQCCMFLMATFSLGK